MAGVGMEHGLCPTCRCSRGVVWHHRRVCGGSLLAWHMGLGSVFVPCTCSLMTSIGGFELWLLHWLKHGQVWLHRDASEVRSHRFRLAGSGVVCQVFTDAFLFGIVGSLDCCRRFFLDSTGDFWPLQPLYPRHIGVLKIHSGFKLWWRHTSSICSGTCAILYFHNCDLVRIGYFHNCVLGLPGTLKGARARAPGSSND
jgi:hypothetical protein